MPIAGSEIVKMLPGRKPCKDCGFPTCFAFAMKLASGGATVDKCPYLSEEVKAKLLDLLAPPIKLVTVGSGENAVRVGNEEVIYRHEKTFVHSPGITLLISDNEDNAKIEEKIKKIKELQFPWVGVNLKANLLALHFASGDKNKFLALVKKVCDSTDVGMILISEDLDVLFEARDICADRHPLVYPITKENIDKAIPKIKENLTPVGIHGKSIEELIPLTVKLKEAGIEELVLDPGSKNLLEAIRDQTFVRKAALKQGFKPLGYPTIAFPCFMAKDGLKEMLVGSAFINKWASIIVFSDFDQYSLLPLLVQRLNIYTDPRFPMAVEEKYYEVGEPDESSPVLVTSNWALTYFLVSSAVEATKVPAYICVKDAEGLGVLTAWAAGKFSGDSVGTFIKKCGIESKVKHRKLVIPGKVARIKGELEDALKLEWEIIVGPKETTGIGAFLPGLAKQLKG
ncbi:MAG: acetyl-CoA decarbonylase/synthase complex subunit gamma [Dehalococcoidia bacterium]|nr:acetyl-CoA decarbonylase/synthase complex subunit gamma [Dehalococcoidia bacterium]MDH4299253.1 acetyl-CoA decarbonylase/synthase complex subunit gamma [Dehalococcoidia bacterium]